MSSELVGRSRVGDDCCEELIERRFNCWVDDAKQVIGRERAMDAFTVDRILRLMMVGVG